MTAPAHASGPVDVVVTNPDGQTATLPGAFTYNAGPTIVSVTPDSGPSAGGTTVTITGTGFGGPGTTVTVDGTSASLDGGSSTSVTFFTPSHVAGTVDVVVSNPDGQQAVAAGAFTHRDGPTLQTITPSQGPAAGGTPVTITGSGFGGPATTVTFGGVTATIESRSATTLDVISPAHASGPVDVVVTNPDGQQAIATTGFLYVPAPSIQSVSPVSGTALGGTQVTVIGSDFGGPGTSVSFDGTNAIVTSGSATSLTATTPAHVAGSVNVVVTNPDGQTATSVARSHTWRRNRHLYWCRSNQQRAPPQEM